MGHSESCTFRQMQILSNILILILWFCPQGKKNLTVTSGSKFTVQGYTTGGCICVVSWSCCITLQLMGEAPFRNHNRHTKTWARVKMNMCWGQLVQSKRILKGGPWTILALDKKLLRRNLRPFSTEFMYQISPSALMVSLLLNRERLKFQSRFIRCEMRVLQHWNTETSSIQQFCTLVL